MFLFNEPRLEKIAQLVSYIVHIPLLAKFNIKAFSPFTVNMPLKCVHLLKIHSARLYVLFYLTIVN